MSKWAELEKELRTQFCLKTHPVGFKRFENPEDLDKIPKLQRMNHLFTICQMIAQARRWGIMVGAKNTDRVNSSCAQIHGLKEVPPDMELPTHGLLWTSSWEDEKKRFKAFPRIPAGGGIVLAPLFRVTFDPDVILIYGDPSQIIMIIQSIQRKEFERFEFACIGESSCADSLAECYLTGKPKVGLPGYGERAFGHVNDEELVIALPPTYLEKALDGFRELRAKGITYPILVVGLDVDLRPTFARRYPDDPEYKQ